MERDWEAKKKGYSAKSYLKVLEDNLPYYYVDGLVFMQDNAPIHTAHKVRDWFRENGIEITDWPPYSPDLDLIEHAWKALKKIVNKIYPELWQASGSRQRI